MKIRIDDNLKKYFNKTGQCIREYRLFIERGSDGKSAELKEECLPIVIDVEDMYYVLKDYGSMSRIIEVYKLKKDLYGIRSDLYLNKPNVHELDGRYSSRIGIEVMMYGTFSPKSCKKRIIKALEKYIQENRWKIDIDLEAIKKAAGV